MSRYLLRVAYDGTNYHGFQLQQDSSIPTIEGELNKALSALLKQPVEVIGASRTDAGVHALDSVVVFDAETTIPADKIPYAVNNLLPDDIVVNFGAPVAADFHPRHTDTRKRYEYRIYRGNFVNPIRSRYTFNTDYKLNIEDMKVASKALVGEHDFKSFCSAHTQAVTTVRKIYDIDIIEEGAEIIISVTGAGFLYNMVRIIAGTLFDVGRGKFSKNDMSVILEAYDREKAGETLPAQGLTLAQFVFDDYPELNR